MKFLFAQFCVTSKQEFHGPISFVAGYTVKFRHMHERHFMIMTGNTLKSKR